MLRRRTLRRHIKTMLPAAPRPPASLTSCVNVCANMLCPANAAAALRGPRDPTRPGPTQRCYYYNLLMVDY